MSKIINNNNINKNKKHGYTVILIILFAIIIICAGAIIFINVSANIKTKNEKAKYSTKIETLLESYKNQDAKKYIELTLPGDLLKLESKYEGYSESEQTNNIKENLGNEKSSITSEYGNGWDYNITVNSVNTPNSSDKKSVESQFDDWMDELDATGKINNIKKIDFNINIKGSKKSENIEDCYAYIVNTDYGDVLWDWNFNNASWDLYSYYA